MVIVPTEKIKSGQILAEEVRDINGRLLLSKGNKIATNHIRIFKIWGITQVNLVAADPYEDMPDGDIRPEIVEQKRESLKPLFRHVDLAHPAIGEIFKIATLFRCEHNISEDFGKPPTGLRLIPQRRQPLNFLKELDQKKIILPEIPSIAYELIEVIENPLSSAEHIARVIGKSPSLTALLLKIVNSSFYGLPARISTVSHAVSLIGTREISGLALGINILSIFKNIPQETIDVYSFFRHSLACGIISRVFAAHQNIPQTEQMFVCGLLHDLGRLILYIHFPDDLRNVLACASRSNGLLYKEEKKSLGCDHALVGRQLMKHWKLPSVLGNTVFYHHKPSQAGQSCPATIVHLADIIVNSLGIGSSGEKFVPPLDYNAWENLQLSPSCFETIIGQAIHQFQGLESMLHA